MRTANRKLQNDAEGVVETVSAVVPDIMRHEGSEEFRTELSPRAFVGPLVGWPWVRAQGLTVDTCRAVCLVNDE